MSDSPSDRIGEALYRVLSQPPKRAIFGVLIEDAGTTLNPSRICERADINLKTFYDHIDELEASGLVTYNYVVGNGPRYEVNRGNLAGALGSAEE